MKKTIITLLSASLVALIACLAQAEIIFQDDFSSGNLNNWTVLSGSWSVINGEICGTADGSRIAPNTGTLTSYVFSCAASFEQGLAWGIDFRYIDPNNRVRLDFAPGAPNQLNVNIYQNGFLVAQPYAGSCTTFGSYTTEHYCKFVVNGPQFEVYFGNSPDNLTLLCSYTFSAFTTGTIRYEVWGYPPNVLSCFDDVLVTSDQPPVVEWAHTYGASAEDHLYCVQRTEPEGGYIAAGCKTVAPNGSQIWIFKTDPDGDSLWSHTWGGTLNDYGFWVEQTNDGGYIMFVHGSTQPPISMLGRLNSIQTGPNNGVTIMVEPETAMTGNV